MLLPWPHRAHTLPVLIMGLALISQTAVGAQWAAEPTIQFRATHDDNLNLETGPHKPVWGGTVSPALNLSRSEQNNSISLYGRLILNRFSNTNEAPDTNVEEVALNSWDKTERNTWNMKAGFTGDTTVVTATGFVQDSTAIVSNNTADVDVNLGSIEVRRQHLYARPSWTRALSERTSLNLGYNFDRLSYSQTANNTLIDYQQHEVDASLSHSVTQTDYVSTEVNFTYYDPTKAGGVSSRGYGLNFHWNHHFSETLSGDTSFGVRSVSEGGQNQNSTGLLFHAALRKMLSQVTNYNLWLERSVQPSGVGSVVQSDRLGVQWYRSLAPRLSAYLSGTAFRNKSLAQSDLGVNRTYFSIGPGLRWSLTRQLAIDASYGYQKQRYEGSAVWAENNSVYVAATYQWAAIAASR